ncbi:MAG: type I glyceraldehyde-3-phosphate dehydrogenase [Leeuwenhoekiella sp.]
MKKLRIGINGFGRIGRRLFRLLHNHPEIVVVMINDVAPISTLAHLLKYDSIHGIFSTNISQEKENQLLVDDNPVLFSSEIEPATIPWDDAQVDLVVEASGKFRTNQMLQGHFNSEIKKVILTVPPLDNTIKMVVLGVNDHILDGSEKIISNASCTTNNAAPMIKVVHDLCEVEQAYISTVHSFTTDQGLHDHPHPDLRRARAAGQSIVPTTTGAAKALTRIFPDLSNVIGGCGIRVPVPNGSLTDMTINVKNKTSIEAINNAFREVSAQSLKGILDYTEVPLVSVDIVGNQHSCIVDGQMTSVIGDLVKLIGWYDNESGYSARLIDLIKRIT